MLKVSTEKSQIKFFFIPSASRTCASTVLLCSLALSFLVIFPAVEKCLSDSALEP